MWSYFWEMLSLTFNSGCPLTVVQYGKFSKSCPRTHLPQQLPILDDLQQALYNEENILTAYLFCQLACWTCMFFGRCLPYDQISFCPFLGRLFLLGLQWHRAM